jgi:hypothetical protein
MYRISQPYMSITLLARALASSIPISYYSTVPTKDHQNWVMLGMQNVWVHLRE